MKPFTITTWNILADAYVRPGRYPKTPPAALEPGTRRRTLLAALGRLDTDVVCLQEVEQSTFDAIREHLEPLGYEWRFCPKGQGAPDGCATGFRSTRFTLSAEDRMAFADGPPDSYSGHVAQLLELRGDGAVVLIANTHLRWCTGEIPPADHLGRRQLALLLAYIEGLEPQVSAVVCGDFNLPPDDGVVAALTAAGLRAALPPLPSANFDGRPRVLDHVCCPQWWGSRALNRSSITPATVLPSSSEPSDHIAVSAELVPRPRVGTLPPAGSPSRARDC